MQNLNNELITPWEVVRYGPVNNQYPTAYVVDHIARKERKLFRKCLGKDLYKAMLDDRKNWSNLPEFDDTQSYGLNDYVIFHGTVIKSLKAGNTDRPDTSDDGWELAEKFEDEAFNELWVLHLRKYLAFEIIYTSVRYATHTVGAKGLVEFYDPGTNTRSVSRLAISDFKTELKDDALDELEDLIEYIKEAVATGEEKYDVFKSALFIEDTCEPGQCSPKASRSRRVFYRY